MEVEWVREGVLVDNVKDSEFILDVYIYFFLFFF